MINIIEDSQVISYDKYEWIENDSVAMFEGFFHQAISFKGELKPKIELISFDSQSDEILDFRRYLC